LLCFKPETILLSFKFICIEPVYVEVSWYCKKKKKKSVFCTSNFFFQISEHRMSPSFYHRTANCRTKIPTIFREIFGVFFLQYFKICIYLFIFIPWFIAKLLTTFWGTRLENTCISSQRRPFMPLSWWQQAPLKRRLLSIPRLFLEDFNFQFSVLIWYLL